jgi:hypothetical protein
MIPIYSDVMLAAVTGIGTTCLAIRKSSIVLTNPSFLTSKTTPTGVLKLQLKLISPILRVMPFISHLAVSYKHYTYNKL